MLNDPRKGDWSHRAFQLAVDAFTRVKQLPVPLLTAMIGAVWVLANLALAWRGIHTSHLYRYFIVAGVIDGAILSVLVVGLLGDKFQAAVAGMIGGISLDSIAGQQTLAQRTIRAIASFVRSVAQEITGLVDKTSGVDGAVLAKAVEYGLWVAGLVVLAALLAAPVVKWILANGLGGAAAKRPPAS